MNHLATQTSRYLLAHADQPVDWWPWCAAAFAEAQRRDVPVLVSIGYSSCHWCHVMSRESFCDPQIGAYLNEHFVAIKVDRDERPDIDQVFMNATQALTGQGGWPNSVFCTPDGKPFFAGTYFPPSSSAGMPSFMELLAALSQAWQTRRDEVMTTGQAIVTELAAQQDNNRSLAGLRAEHTEPTRLLGMLHTGFDSRHGGFGLAPKFPQAALLDALFARTEQLDNDRALFTLEAMARGGIHDQVGGGFHRYAVDEGWEVPHFEKMLYDNALLLDSYTSGWLHATPDDGTEQRELFERVVSGIVGWLTEEMRLPAGAFAASLDADSLNDAGESEEGAYYLWSPQLFDEYLGRDSRFAQGVFHVTYGGNLPAGAHEPTDGTGRSTLQLHGNPHPGRLANILAVLGEVRRTRPAPQRDDTVIAAWNGLLINSLVRAAMVFGQAGWLKSARECADYLWREHWDRHTRLLHRTTLTIGDEVRRGPAGVLVDYAAVALGYLRLAGALGDPGYLERACELLDRAQEVFYRDGKWADAVASAELFSTPNRLDDDSTPSASATLLVALRAAALLSGRDEYDHWADELLDALRQVLVYSPRYAGWALAELIAGEESAQGRGPAKITIVDDGAEPMNEMSRAAWRLAPWGSVVVNAQAGEDFGMAEMSQLANRPTAYICHGARCQKPVDDWGELRALLWG